MIGERIGGAPRTRTELNLLGKGDPRTLRVPRLGCLGARPFGSAGECGAVREGSDPTNG